MKFYIRRYPNQITISGYANKDCTNCRLPNSEFLYLSLSIRLLVLGFNYTGNYACTECGMVSRRSPNHCDIGEILTIGSLNKMIKIYLNCGLNPIMYSFMNPRFLKTLQQLWNNAVYQFKAVFGKLRPGIGMNLRKVKTKFNLFVVTETKRYSLHSF